jgi:hypothetical protein
MLRVTVDIPFTRRKVYHIVQDEAGAVIHRARYFSQTLDWLQSEGVEVYQLRGPNGRTMLVQPFDATKKD